MSTEAMADAVVNAEPVEAGIDVINKENLDPNPKTDVASEAAPETEGELQEAIEKAVEDGATKEEVKEMIKEFEIKVNGKRKKVKIDLNDEKDLIRRLQMAEAGQHAMQESAELKKMVEQELQKARNNPWEFLKELGLDPDMLAEQRITDAIEEMKKSPEQIEKEKLEKELMSLRNELEKEKVAKEEAKVRQLQDQAALELDKEIDEAFKTNPNLPKTRKTVRRIADAMVWAIEEGYTDVRVSDVIPAVEEEIRREFNEFVAALPEEAMESFLGKNILDRMRKKRVAEAKKSQEIPSLNTQTISKPKEEKKEEERKDKVKARDFFRTLR